ncbi:glutathione S-transferase N-terminal domain-containing protein [Caulobacter sp. S45]|uniref:glutathione S-transferase N-terminal domain-containing protein n=1 Tax=Caulobacter sp. S45 TaxID=1641861 RepID=UPI00352FF07B
MKLYSDAYAPNPRRVLWLMAEKGIADIEVVHVDLAGGAHRAPRFLDMAGVSAVPQLELDDGEVLGESLAICRYLESLYPKPNLFGRDPLETARIEAWTRPGRADVRYPPDARGALRPPGAGGRGAQPVPRARRHRTGDGRCSASPVRAPAG